ncbi:hypothetical protein [Nautilia sp.]
MTLNEVVKKSDFILTEGNKKIGKLTLALYYCEKKRTVIFSSYQKSVFLKRMSAIANLKDDSIQTALSTVKFFTLKENWNDYKKQYGTEYLFEDIKKAVKKHSPKNIVFHRLDILFGTNSQQEVSFFMKQLNIFQKENRCKVFITVIPNGENESTIETIEDFCDLNLEIQKDKNRIINVKNSIFPVKPEKYLFLYDNEIKITPYEKNPTTQKKAINVLIISENEELINLHKYVFNSKYFFVDEAKNISEIINKILSAPDLIIYNPKEEHLDMSVCNTLKQQSIPSKLIYIAQTEYVRTEDKMKALESGCYEIFPENFALGEYILEIEKMLDFNFYTPVLNRLFINKIFNDIKSFCDVLDSLYEEKVFFTILKFESDSSPEKYVKKLRNTDILFYDQNKSLFIICLINLRKRNIKPVFNKLFLKETPDVTLYETYQWPDVKEEICK